MRWPAALLLAAAVAAPAAAIDMVYRAFGDSHTSGKGDEFNLGGYPYRLDLELDAIGRPSTVSNHGKAGERTTGGLTRIDSVLAFGGDVVLLMQGANDLFCTWEGGCNIPPEAITFNLEQMAAKAAAAGLDTVHLTVIPLKVKGANQPHPFLNPEAQELEGRIVNSANSQERWKVGFHALWGSSSSLYQNYYDQNPSDPVGHPRGTGYNRMAKDIRIVLAGPTPATPVPTAPSGDVVTATPTYRWPTHANSTWYRLQVRDGAGALVLEKWYRDKTDCGATECAVTPATALAGGPHTFTVVGRNPGRYGAVSAAKAFTYWASPPAAAPGGSSPAGPTFATMPVFKWSQLGDATEYQLQIDGPSGSVHDQVHTAAAACSGSTCSRSPVSLAAGSYTWRVRGGNPAGLGPWSGDYGFEVRACPAQTDLTVGPGQLPDGGTTSAFYEACGVITVTGFRVLSGGDATFLAGASVVLQDGTEVGDGGAITIHTDP